MIPILKKRLGRFGGAVSIRVVEVTHTKTGTFSATFRGTNGAVIYCDPGDGTPVQEKTLLGTGTDVVFSYINTPPIERTVRVWGDVTSVERLTIPSNNINSFNLAAFKSLNNLVFQTNNVSDISSLANMPLTFLLFHSNSVSDISVFSTLTSLASIFCNSNNISDLSPISSLSLSGSLYLRNNNISDLSPVFNLSNLTTLAITGNATTYTTQTWPAWSGNSYNFGSTVSTSGEVDQKLIDAAAGGVNNTTLYLDGTNPARTSASDAAVATLVANNVILHLT